MAKIIIVDSDKETVSAITDLMKDGAHTISCLQTEAQLMGSLGHGQPDLMIIGVNLDGSDGRVVSKMLQMESPYKNIPVILTSPYYHTDAEIRSFCCDDLVSMPYDGYRLVSSIDSLLAKEKARITKLESA